MTDLLLGLAIGSGVTILVFLIGLGWVWTGYYLRARYRARLNPSPVCGCEHHFSYHDESGCGWQTYSRYEAEALHCGCKKYIGPVPLPEYTS